MSPLYSWEQAYLDAVLDAEWPAGTLRKIEAAESQIHQTQMVMIEDHGGTSPERSAIAKALRSLVTLRTDVTEWQAEIKAEEKSRPD